MDQSEEAFKKSLEEIRNKYIAKQNKWESSGLQEQTKPNNLSTQRISELKNKIKKLRNQ